MEKVGAYTERATEGGEWRSGNPASGQQATPMLSAYFNMLQRELVAVVESAGIGLDKDDDNQLLQAIRRLRGGAATNFGQWAWSNSLAGNPGAGRVALNHAAPGSATALLITETSSEGVDFTQSLGLLRAGDTITLHERDSTNLSHRFRVTGPAVDEGTYRSIPVAYVSGAGSVPGVDAMVSVLLTQAGASDASIPLFMPQWWPNRAAIPAGYAPADGQLLSRATFPDAWAGIQAGNVPTVADATWLSTPAQRGRYTAGDGATSFRLPDYNGKSAGSIGAPFMRGDGALSAAVAGAIQGDAVRNITGQAGSAMGAGISPEPTGPFRKSASATGSYTGTGTTWFSVDYDLSRVAPTASENRPLNLTGCWIIKIFGSVTNPGSADAAQLATDLAALVSRVTTLETKWQVLQVRDEKPSGTSGGTFTTGADRTRDLNTVVANTIPGASLASNRITLPAGTYDVLAMVPSYRNGSGVLFSRASLQTLGGAILADGSNSCSGGTASGCSALSVVRGRFSLAAITDVELRHYGTGESTSGTGFGQAVSVSGRNEIYSSVLIERVV